MRPSTNSSFSLRTRRWISLGIFILGFLLVTFYGLRSYQEYQHLQKIEAGGFSVQSLHGWMTMSYIAQRYEVPEAELYSSMGVSSETNGHSSLRDLIEYYGLDESAARHAIEQVILQHKQQNRNE